MSAQDPGTGWRMWDDGDARAWIAVPAPDDDKYTRGVLGMLTGSAAYPGAAVLGVEAAWRTGVGMVRYLGPQRAADLVLTHRPETVTAPGRVQAWLAGSGMDARERSEDAADRLRRAAADGVPCVLDAGALDLAGSVTGPAVITPHHRELSGVLRDGPDSPAAEQIRAEPAAWAARAAESLGVVVLLKGHTTHVAAPGADRIAIVSRTAWLATAGTGDVLAGIIGALTATHSEAIADGGSPALARIAATGVLVHQRAAERASGGGPVTALDVARAVPATIAALLAR